MIDNTDSDEIAPPNLDGKVGFERMLLLSEHRQQLLAKALGDLLVAFGAATEGTPLTGPQLLLLAKDATALTGRLGTEAMELEQMGWFSEGDLFYTEGDRARSPHVPLTPAYRQRSANYRKQS